MSDQPSHNRLEEEPSPEGNPPISQCFQSTSLSQDEIITLLDAVGISLASVFDSAKKKAADLLFAGTALVKTAGQKYTAADKDYAYEERISREKKEKQYTAAKKEEAEGLEKINEANVLDQILKKIT
jgi:hypothetical protein